MKEWLEEFAYHTELSSLIFLSVLIISLILVIISGGYAAWKSGNGNPVDVINVG
jgi:ABC-type lipoprotein release transport system permease subunit